MSICMVKPEMRLLCDVNQMKEQVFNENEGVPVAFCDVVPLLLKIAYFTLTLNLYNDK